MEEIWKDIPGYEGLYQVSNLGRVKSILRSDKYYSSKGRILTPEKSTLGYLRVCLYSQSIPKRQFIHRLVAQTFIPNPDNKPQIDHIDGNPSNNNRSNLRWVTAKENVNNPVAIQRRATVWETRISPFKGLYGKRNYNARAILRIAPNGEVKEYASIAEASKDGFNPTNISICCAGNKYLHYRGFDWRYKEGDKKPKFNLQYAIDHKGEYKTPPLRPRKKILRERGEEQKIYISVKEAVDDGFDRRCIIKCCNGQRNSHKGYHWSFLP